MSSYIDEKTGVEVIKLTENGLNKHLYFTENSFYGDDKSILLARYDGDAKSYTNGELFKLDLETGIRTQLTDFASEGLKATLFNKTINGELLSVIIDGDLYVISTETGERRLVLRAPVGYSLGATSFSFDGRYIAVAANEKVACNSVQKAHENYGGFKENFYLHKRGKIMIAKTDGTEAFTVFDDTHWVGHVQFAPDTNEYLSYCHEGPWNYVQQRIWILNTITRSVIPCYRQEERDSLGHEFWTRDGLVFYDNRGRGHDGTITSDKSQAVTMDYDGPEDIPEVGFVNKEGEVVRRLEVPYYCNHYHANVDNTLLVADAVNDIVLIDISTDKAKISTLCTHDTSWRYQMSHCHPTFSWSNDAILFASDRDREGVPNLYLVKMDQIKK